MDECLQKAKDEALLAPVLHQINQRLQRDGRVLVAIDGPCGSGKTTLAARLGDMYGVQPIPMDDFFLPFDKRTPERLSAPGGNVDYERFLSQVLAPLMRGGSFVYDRFDCATGALIPKRHEAKAVTLIEGSYSHHPAFATVYEQLAALRVFVQIDAQEQLRRIALRDPEGLQAFQSKWIPLEKSYFQAYDIVGEAHVRLISQPWPTLDPTTEGEAH